MKKKEDFNRGLLIAFSIVLLITAGLNAYTVSSLSDSLSGSKVNFEGLDKVDVSTIANTGQAIAKIFPIDQIKTHEDAIALMIATGEPEYGNMLPISYDDPLTALSYLQKYYPTIKSEVQKDPELWQRYLNLATKPVGISCEFCCGVGPSGISKDGELLCGCSHNPAIQALTLWLIKNTDYTDAEILKEDLVWKTIWFPKDMIQLGLKASGGDIDLNALPSMVGGC